MDVSTRIRQILDAEAAAIAAIEVGPAYDAALDMLAGTRGRVLTTGMGKAGHIARKFAATLCSTATPAAFLHPGEALHGDLGLIGAGDVLVVLSNSGKTREVIATVSLGRQLGLAGVIGITGHADSDLREHADVIIDMGHVPEACVHGLTPTASIAVMLAITDALALTLMERRGVSPEDFGVRHHGGYLGDKVRGKG